MAMPSYALVRGIAGLGIAVVACAKGDGTRLGTHTVVDSVGIRIVESHTGAWGDGGRRIDSEPFLRLGTDGEGPFQFTFVVQGRLLDGGEFAVTESATGQVRIFDTAGAHRRTLGRSGDGPGEFRIPVGPFAYPGDSLAVYDAQLRRTTIFPRSGGEPRVVRHEARGNHQVFGALRDGRLLTYNPGSGYRPGVPPGLQWDTTDILSVDPADGTSRAVARLASRQQWVEPDGNTRRFAPAHRAVQAVGDDGFYWGLSDRYEIRFHDAEGGLRRILRRPVEPRAVDRAMIEQYVTAVLEWTRASQGDAAAAAQQRTLEEASYGDRVPVFDIAFVDQDQRLWVSAPIWPSFQEPPRRWSVFSPDGVWLGDLDAPEGLWILDSRGEIVLGIWRNALDVPHVQLHRLVR